MSALDFLGQAIARTASTYGHDPATLTRIRQLESGSNPFAKNPNSSAGGPWQFIDSTWGQYGNGGDRYDIDQSTDAVGRYLRDVDSHMTSQLGRQLEPWELYLGHQQGMGGATKLLSNPGARAADLVGADAVRLNGGNTDMTAGEFASIWKNKFNKSGPKEHSFGPSVPTYADQKPPALSLQSEAPPPPQPGFLQAPEARTEQETLTDDTNAYLARLKAEAPYPNQAPQGGGFLSSSTPTIPAHPDASTVPTFGMEPMGKMSPALLEQIDPMTAQRVNPSIRTMPSEMPNQAPQGGGFLNAPEPVLTASQTDPTGVLGPSGTPPPTGTPSPAPTPQSVAPTVSPQEAAPVLTEGSEEERKGLWQKVFGGKSPKWLTPARRDFMLAMGTGLLAGEDWHEGLAIGAQNLNSIVSQSRAEANSEARAEASNQTNVYNRPVNVAGRDPSTGMEVVRSATMVDGVPHIHNDEGTLVPAHTILNEVRIGGRSETQDVTSGAGGIPNATFVSEGGIPTFSFKREGEQKTYGYALRAIGAEKDLDNIMAVIGPEGMTSLQAGLQQWASNNARTSISGATINEIVNSSGLQGAAASTMTAYLQAVLRADTGAAYTGTEIANYAAAFLPSPGDNASTLAQKENLRKRELLRFAGTTGAAGPYLSGVIEGKYNLPGGYWQAPATNSPALNQSNPVPATSPEVDDILNQYGL